MSLYSNFTRLFIRQFFFNTRFYKYYPERNENTVYLSLKSSSFGQHKDIPYKYLVCKSHTKTIGYFIPKQCRDGVQICILWVPESFLLE